MQPLLKNTRRHDITFHRNGLIRITARVARCLNLNPGDSINIAFDAGEYLLFSIHHHTGRHKAQCHPSKRGSRNFCAHSVSLSSQIFTVLGISAPKVSFMVGEQIERSDNIYLPIITKYPIC